MKKFICMCLLIGPAVSLAGEVDGKNFCRTVVSDGLFNQPAGTREHCVSFKRDVMTDNANTFFGRLPESINYVLVGGKLLVVRKGKLQSEYNVNENLDQLQNKAGAILDLQ